MRKHIQDSVDMIFSSPISDPRFAQNLRSGLQVLGEELSRALDRLDKLEGGGDFLSKPDVLGDPNALK